MSLVFCIVEILDASCISVIPSMTQITKKGAFVKFAEQEIFIHSSNMSTSHATFTKKHPGKSIVIGMANGKIYQAC